MKKVIFAASVFSLALANPVPVFSQAPGVPIERTTNRKQDADLLQKADKLNKAGKLKMTIDAVKAQLQTPKPGRVEFADVKKKPLSGREIARAAREGHAQFGWYYMCTKCDHWHLNLAGAYAIASDTIATCNHCVEPGSDMKEGYLIAVDYRGEVFPVSAVLAKSQTLDGAVLRVDGKFSSPLAFNDDVHPGDPAFCYSTPLGQSGYFSEGIVNRFYWRGAPGKEGAANQWRNLRVNVSTDWAPGSSGSAVLDQAGNVIGHVSTIHPLSEGPRPSPQAEERDGKKGKAPKADRFGGATLITLHDATPARGMLELGKPLRDFKRGDEAAGENAIEKPTSSDGLKVGAKAPALKTGKWVQGESVAKFETGKVYIVEFWATWCGPCRATIPHLNDLHKKFSDKGVVVIGQNVWEQDTKKVEPFIKSMGDKMTYRVALDAVEGEEPDSGSMAVNWMKAAGQKGIPSAFLVDQEGTVAWIGHPAQLTEQMIEDVLARKFDITKSKADSAASEKIREAMMRYGSKAVKAMTDEKWDDALKFADEFAAALPAGKKAIAEALRFKIADGRKDSTQANEAADRVLAAEDADYKVLNEVAWALVTSKNLEKPDFDIASKLAQRSVEKSTGSSKAAALDTLARALFRAGKKEEAVLRQEEALTATPDEKMKSELTETLKAYQKGELPPAT
jgi:thiol-disulfide isomerase/thioredoxin